MIYYARVGTHQVSIETAQKITCILAGQRDEMKERPMLLLEKEWRIKVKHAEEKLTTDEIMEIAQYHAQRTHHKWGMVVLGWFESEEEAKAAEAKWPEHINFEILPITSTTRSAP